ncbi:MAG: J domain-containing protein [Solirubrobacteraceae bacterium]|jgi:curved DNA-binding protein CbpA
MSVAPGAPDPYQTLGVRRSASDAEVRAAYRRLVQLHHPDHNGGSAQSARRFEEVQDAYARVRTQRQATSSSARAGSHPREGSAPRGAQPGPSAPGDPRIDERLAAMERELTAARAAREQAVRDARRAREQALRDAREASEQTMRDLRPPGSPDRPSDEELGYVTTDDSVSKILDDVASELSGRLSEVRRSPAAHKLADLIDELGAKLTGDPPDHT